MEAEVEEMEDEKIEFMACAEDRRNNEVNRGQIVRYNTLDNMNAFPT